MIPLLKLLPFVVLFALAVVLGYTLVINGYKGQVVELQQQLDGLAQDNAVLSATSEINTRTINDMRETNARQLTSIGSLTTQNSAILKEHDEYMSIFREHDLTNLSRAKPGLIEPRINNGTRDILKQLTIDSQERTL